MAAKEEYVELALNQQFSPLASKVRLFSLSFDQPSLVKGDA